MHPILLQDMPCNKMSFDKKSIFFNQLKTFKQEIDF